MNPIEVKISNEETYIVGASLLIHPALKIYTNKNSNGVDFNILKNKREFRHLIDALRLMADELEEVSL